jgi:hypothetical protein
VILRYIQYNGRTVAYYSSLYVVLLLDRPHDMEISSLSGSRRVPEDRTFLRCCKAPRHSFASSEFGGVRSLAAIDCPSGIEIDTGDKLIPHPTWACFFSIIIHNFTLHQIPSLCLMATNLEANPVHYVPESTAWARVWFPYYY